MRRTEGERERRTEKDDRRKEVGLAPVCRLLSGNTYDDQRGGRGGREARNRTKRKKDARAEAAGERMQEQKERE